MTPPTLQDSIKPWDDIPMTNLPSLNPRSQDWIYHVFQWVFLGFSMVESPESTAYSCLSPTKNMLIHIDWRNKHLHPPIIVTQFLPWQMCLESGAIHSFALVRQRLASKRGAMATAWRVENGSMLHPRYSFSLRRILRYTYLYMFTHIYVYVIYQHVYVLIYTSSRYLYIDCRYLYIDIYRSNFHRRSSSSTHGKLRNQNAPRHGDETSCNRTRGTRRFTRCDAGEGEAV